MRAGAAVPKSRRHRLWLCFFDTESYQGSFYKLTNRWFQPTSMYINKNCGVLRHAA